jgi:purine-binding chemotaxis protein CheW
MEVVVFQVAGRSYALSLEHVVEVLRMVAVTPLPETPPWVLGVVNLRGTLIPMIDLRPRLGLAAAQPDPAQVFLVARARGRTVGLLADSVGDIVQVAGAGQQLGGDTEATGPILGGTGELGSGAVVTISLEQLIEALELGGWGSWVNRAGGARDDLAQSGTPA